MINLSVAVSMRFLGMKGAFASIMGLVAVIFCRHHFAALAFAMGHVGDDAA